MNQIGSPEEQIKMDKNIKVKSNKIKISMTIDKELYDRFKVYCDDNSMKVSTRVSRLIEVELSAAGLQDMTADTQ